MANLLNGLGGDAGFGENFLDRNDDQSTGLLDLSAVFAFGLNFFGTTYDSLYVNNNGNVTFNAARRQFTPNTITSLTSNPEISAFLADVDTRGGVVEATPGGTSTGSNLVWYDLDAANRTFTVTYDDVGYFSGRTDRLNAFQIVLTDASADPGRTRGDFDIGFRYEDVNWTTGEASDGVDGLGGIVARAGFSAGFGQATSFFELPQSGLQDQVLALHTLPGNTGEAGLWRFEVRNGDVPATVSISSTTPRQNEGDGGTTEFFFNLVRSGDVTTQITVPYTVSGSGTRPIDALDLAPAGLGLPYSGTVTFAPGITNVQIAVPIRGDLGVEASEFVTVTLTGAASGSLGYGQRQATATVANDDGLAPTVPFEWTFSTWFGDPHLTTWDGLFYDFQAAGEFVLARSTAGAAFEVQARYEAVPLSDVATVATAVATRVDGRRVSYDAEADTLRIDGAATVIDPLAGSVAVGAGSIFLDPDGSLRVIYPDGLQTVILTDRGDHLDVQLAADPSRGGQFAGLLGDFNGSTADDLALADGTPLAQPVSFADLYGPYAASWRVGAGSLFDYAAGEGTGTFTNPALPAAAATLADFPDALVAAARAAATAAGVADPTLRDAAAFDFLLTGDASYLASAADQPAPAAVLVPTGAPTALLLGISGPSGPVDERDSGPTEVAFTFYRTGGEGALTVGYQLLAGGTADAADFAGAALPSGIVTFADGETERQLVVQVAGDAVAELDETFTLRISSATADVLLASGQASATIANDDGAVLPTIDIASWTGLVDEGTGTGNPLRITLTRSSSLEAATVQVSVAAAASGPSVSADDIVGGFAPATVAFAAGQDTAMLTIEVAGDAAFEADEGLRYVLSNPTGAVLGSPAEVTAIIRNDDAAPPVPDGIVLGDGDDDVGYATAAAAVTVRANGGNDAVTGSRFGDVLEGGAGFDRLRGGAGGDTIAGGAGFDRVQGGAGSDVFLFRAGDLVIPRLNGGQHDHVIDFQGAGGAGVGDQDLLRFEGFGAGASLVLVSAANPALAVYAVIDGAEQGRIIVQTGNGALLTAADYAFA